MKHNAKSYDFRKQSKEIWQNRIQNDLSRKHVKPPWIAGALCYQFGEIFQLLKVVIKTASKNWTSILKKSQIYIPFHFKLWYKRLSIPFSPSPIFSLPMIREIFSYLYKIWEVISLMGVHESLPPSLELQSK